eukprot:8872813-Lingulodinium_polyedra.AAC.1
MVCTSRARQAEWENDWSFVPPLCRADDIGLNNEELQSKRQNKAEAANSSGAASSPGAASG